MVKRAGQKAKLPFQVHAHMLRHSAGYKLAGDGHDTRSIQDYLGHRDIRIPSDALSYRRSHCEIFGATSVLRSAQYKHH
jgi:integrase